MIHIFVPILQPYRIKFYKKLNSHYGDSVIVHHGEHSESSGRVSFDKEVPFKTKGYPERRNKLFSFHILFWKNFSTREVKKGDVVIIQPILGNLTIFRAIIMARLSGAKVIFWVCAFEPPHKKILGYIKNLVVRFGYSMCHKAICYSSHAHRYSERVGVEPENITIALNGVDLPDKVEKVREADGKFIIGYVGAVIPEKKPSKLLETISSLPENFEIEVIGDGTELNELRARYASEPRVHFHGKKTDNETFFADVDLIVVPGQGGLVAIEAVFQNTYVLCSDVCDPAVYDVILDKKNGEFFSNETTAVELASIIISIKKRKPFVESQYGSEWIRKNFTTDTMFTKFCQSIDSVK